MERKLVNFLFFLLYALAPGQINFFLHFVYFALVYRVYSVFSDNILMWIYYVYAEKRNFYRLLVGKPEGKRPLGRQRRRWVDNIRMELG
jgi:hypothetical protein